MLINSMKAMAMKNLQKDGYLAPVFFLCKGETLVAEPQQTSMFDRHYGDNVNAEDSKTRAVFCMGTLAKAIGATRLIMIWDAAMRTVPPDFKYNATEAPLAYPKSMRTECIIINDIWFDTGKDYTTIVPYKGGDNEPVEFINDCMIPEGAALDSRFTEIAIKGYNKIP